MPHRSVPIIINWGLKGTPNWFSSFSLNFFIIFAHNRKWWNDDRMRCLHVRWAHTEVRVRWKTNTWQIRNWKEIKIDVKVETNIDGNLVMKGNKSQSSIRLVCHAQYQTALRYFKPYANLDIKKSNKFFVIKITFMCVAP